MCIVIQYGIQSLRVPQNAIQVVPWQKCSFNSTSAFTRHSIVSPLSDTNLVKRSGFEQCGVNKIIVVRYDYNNDDDNGDDNGDDDGDGVDADDVDSLSSNVCCQLWEHIVDQN